jgi:hypothetical protein
MKIINAIDLLKEIVQQRNWHNGKIERKAAYNLKRNLKTGSVSYEKASEILKLLGYEKVKEEVWATK